MSASAVLKLQKVGFTVDQVEALADLIDTQAASKADLLEVKSELKTEIIDVERRLETKISEAKVDILKSMMSMIFGAVLINVLAIMGGLFGLAKLLGH